MSVELTLCSSISIACWVVVFSPQIIENFRRSSADGLSLTFIIVWLLGDVFNILGAILQGVLPTMTILAVYYTLADIVLLGQCFYYRGFTLSDAPADKVPSAVDEEAVAEEREPTEQSSLLPQNRSSDTPRRPTIADANPISSRGSFSSLHSRLSNSRVDATHLSPATPFLPPPKPTDTPRAVSPPKPASTLYTVFFNFSAIVLVCAAGVLGWWLSSRSPHHHYPEHHHRHDRHTAPSTEDAEEPLRFDFWGQVFGYLCAVLYLGSRIPQLLLNFRRKSTEGVSLLFFLFACVGNLTYVMSIFAYEPACARLGSVNTSVNGGWCEEGDWSRGYGRYILLTASWLIGSAGTLVLDLMIFGQFWMYRDRSPQTTQ